MLDRICLISDRTFVNWVIWDRILVMLGSVFGDSCNSESDSCDLASEFCDLGDS